MELSEFDNDEQQQFVSDSFVVDDDSKADWALRKLAHVRAQMAANAAIAKQEQDRIEQWLERVNDKLKSNATYFEGLLASYATLERTHHDRKTIDLPHGKIKSRAVKAKVEIVDETTFIQWAKESKPELIRVKESPNLSALSEFVHGFDVVTEDGEIVPAVQVVPERINYIIETD